ncbi:hypothetical protein [Glycomyces rhizosphaerae]|uniref:TIGR04222 domain-containing membrane protein n=1 Tax=Glycomyces rhizosphaerae TaxID=2054422 RepID=A0ABV7Q0S3_9ACTN
MTTAIVLGAIGMLLVFVIVRYGTPRARGRRAVERRKRREMAELRSRVAANARATYDRQFPRARRSRSGSTSYSGGTVTYGADSGSYGGSGCDSGGGDSGGGGGDGGGC